MLSDLVHPNCLLANLLRCGQLTKTDPHFVLKALGWGHCTPAVCHGSGPFQGWLPTMSSLLFFICSSLMTEADSNEALGSRCSVRSSSVKSVIFS